MESRQKISENAAEQFLIILAHFDRIVDRILAMAKEIESSVVKSLIILVVQCLQAE